MEFIKKYKDKIIIFVIIIVIALNGYIYKVKSNSLYDNQEIVSQENLEDKEFTEKDIKESSEIMIHITGAVKNPGVIEVDKDFRLKDVVDKCGGLKDDADINNINLAMKVEDEMKIHIPSIEETNENIKDISNINQNIDNQNNKVNLNKATKEELMTLPGIGESKSEKIIQYREDNIFKKIDDIKNVNGIGDKTFESFKDLIDV